jgi:hypothetical protein
VNDGLTALDHMDTHPRHVCVAGGTDLARVELVRRTVDNARADQRIAWLASRTVDMPAAAWVETRNPRNMITAAATYVTGESPGFGQQWRGLLLVLHDLDAADIDADTGDRLTRLLDHGADRNLFVVLILRDALCLPVSTMGAVSNRAALGTVSEPQRHVC